MEKPSNDGMLKLPGVYAGDVSGYQEENGTSWGSPQPRYNSSGMQGGREDERTRGREEEGEDENAEA